MQLFSVTENIENGIEEFMKRNIALLLVLLLLVSVGVFAFTACDDEEPEPEPSNFEKYHGERFLEEYTYSGTRLRKKQSEDGPWGHVITWWDEDSGTESFDDFVDYVFIITYHDGKNPNPFWNEMFLRGRKWLTALGESVTLTKDAIYFDGSLGSNSIEFNDIDAFSADVELLLTEEQENEIGFNNTVLLYHPFIIKHDENHYVELSLSTPAFEYEGMKYYAEFFYVAPCNCLNEQ